MLYAPYALVHSGGTPAGSSTGASRSMGGLSRGTSSRGGGGWESEIEIDMLQVMGAGLYHYAALHIELQTTLSYFPLLCGFVQSSG